MKGEDNDGTDRSAAGIVHKEEGLKFIGDVGKGKRHGRSRQQSQKWIRDSRTNGF